MFNIFKKIKSNTRAVEGGAVIGKPSRELAQKPTLLFKVYSANGGIVLNFFDEHDIFSSKSPYDQSSLYIIKDSDDLAHRVSQIITLELMNKKSY